MAAPADPPVDPPIPLPASEEAPADGSPPPAPEGGDGSADPPAPVDASEDAGEGDGAPAEGRPPADAGAPDPTEKPPKQDWRDARIARLTAQLKAARAGEPAPAGDEPPPAPGASPEERLSAAAIENRARELADQRRAIDDFNRSCVETAKVGKATFTDFDARIADLRQLAGDGEDVQQQIQYNQFVAAAIETGEAPKLLHHLGGDLDEAQRIMSLPPVRMAVELTKLAARAPDTSTTKAPKPIQPVGGRSAAHTQIDPTDPERSDKLTTAQFMERRNAQDRARNESLNGRGR